MNGSKKSSAIYGLKEATETETPVHSKAPPRHSFALAKTDTSLDPRIHAYRDDIADIALADRIALPHYVDPLVKQVSQTVANLYSEPSETAELGSQLLYGEAFALLEVNDSWAWGYGLHDHFVGFIAKAALGDRVESSHIVAVPKVSLEGADNKVLLMGSRIVGRVDGERLVTDHGLLAIEDTIPIGATLPDAAAVAEQFLGAPYLLGGRSIDGIDCSGLVQIAWGMAGHPLQRDSDLQQVSAGEELAVDADLQRGDLIFFPEHVGMMADAETLIHASGHNGKVCTEALKDVVARIAEKHENPVLARRRIR